jgi:UDP-GlcNAc:undecaprenyl-phosphate GlcNAc-1-phosphate transferase
MRRAAGAIAVGAVAAVTARAAYAGLRRRPPAGEKTWTRTNHRGELVTLVEGPAASFGAIAAELICAAVAAKAADRATDSQKGAAERSRGARSAGGMALAGAGALAFGLIDDLAGSGKRRGLRGHLGALAHGELTTGTVKLGGLAATGFAASVFSNTAPGNTAPGNTAPGNTAPGNTAPGNTAGGNTASDRAIDVLIDAGLIAGGANLLNLFDLRPGRAIKVAVLSGGLIAVGGAVTGRPQARSGGRAAGLAAVAAPLGASLALLPEDLGERAMLGDAGANALGAMLGAAAARSLPRPARIGLLAGIVALTVVSEKVSFTSVIERTPPLRRLDLLGRRPAPGVWGPGANTATPPRQRMGRHRRVDSGVGRVRSAARFFQFFYKTPARQEP